DLRKYLTNLNPGNLGRNRLELAADLDGRLGLDVPHVLVRRPATQEDVDHRFVLSGTAGLGLGLKQPAQGQATRPETQRPDLEEAAPRDPVAVCGFPAQDRQHGRTALSCWRRVGMAGRLARRRCRSPCSGENESR